MEIMARRNFLEAAQLLAKTRDTDIEHILAVTHSLSQLITDLIGRDCELILRFKNPYKQTER